MIKTFLLLFDDFSVKGDVVICFLLLDDKVNVALLEECDTLGPDHTFLSQIFFLIFDAINLYHVGTPSFFNIVNSMSSHRK